MQGTLIADHSAVLEHNLERRKAGLSQCKSNVKPNVAKETDFSQTPKRSPTWSMLINLIKDEKMEVTVDVLRVEPVDFRLQVQR